MLLFGQELRMRDKIIEEQKILIQKNNIINRITYTRLNAQTEVLPDFFSQLAASHNRSLISNLSEAHRPTDVQQTHSPLKQDPTPNKSAEARQSPIKTNKPSKKPKPKPPRNKSLLDSNPVDVSW